MGTSTHGRTLVRNMMLVVLCVALTIAGFPPEQAAAHHGSRSVTWPAAWRSPLPGTTVAVTANYRAYSTGCSNADRSHAYTWYLPSPDRAQHLGLDLKAEVGTRVHAISDGRVTRSTADGPVDGYSSGSKGVVVVEHTATNKEKFTAVYAHVALAANPRTKQTWRANDMVRSGEVLGTIVRAGTGPHLHFGIRPGSHTSVAGINRNTGTVGTSCPDTRRNTVEPVSYLSARKPLPLAGSIVGWRNSDGSVVRWRIQSVDGQLRRRWIPDQSHYRCWLDKGAVDRGVQRARFLDQLPDQKGTWSRCS